MGFWQRTHSDLANGGIPLTDQCISDSSRIGTDLSPNLRWALKNTTTRLDWLEAAGPEHSRTVGLEGARNALSGSRVKSRTERSCRPLGFFSRSRSLGVFSCSPISAFRFLVFWAIQTKLVFDAGTYQPSGCCVTTLTSSHGVFYSMALLGTYCPRPARNHLQTEKSHFSLKPQSS